MPSVKPPPKPKNDTTQSAMLVLTVQNLEEMVRWYRRSAHPGHELGHILMKELALADVSHALTLGIEGRRWVPPAE